MRPSFRARPRRANRLLAHPSPASSDGAPPRCPRPPRCQAQTRPSAHLRQCPGSWALCPHPGLPPPPCFPSEQGPSFPLAHAPVLLGGAQPERVRRGLCWPSAPPVSGAAGLAPPSESGHSLRPSPPPAAPETPRMGTRSGQPWPASAPTPGASPSWFTLSGCQGELAPPAPGSAGRS